MKIWIQNKIEVEKKEKNDKLSYFDKKLLNCHDMILLKLNQNPFNNFKLDIVQLNNLWI